MNKIDEIKNYAQENHVPIMLDGGIEFLCEYIKKENTKRILECGTAIGYSSIKMAKCNDDILIDTCEINPKLVELARQNIETEGLTNRITVHQIDAVLFETTEKYDLIFVDAAKAQYKKYMEHFLGNVSQDGVFVFDNLCFHGIVDNPELTKSRNTKQLVKKIKVFRDFICTDPKFETLYYPEVGDGVAIVKVK
ncbi:O-methyltransferase [Anaerorhabdus sp.]|uniref:O-methyltransferase n=1 Tax=Anaerorhabdus sp. TaxID=1872524 RepID=UPI002FCA2D25